MSSGQAASHIVCMLTRRELSVSLLALLACRSNIGPSDQSLVEEAIANGLVIPRRDRPYEITSPITLDQGASLKAEAGTGFLYVGGNGGQQPMGIFAIRGDGVTITGPFTVESASPNRLLYAVIGSDVSDLSITGVSAIDCNHVYLSTSGGYKGTVMSGNRANACRRIVIRDGGSVFRDATLPKTGHGSCFIGYAADWRVEGASYENVSHAVQWWGGNADLRADGALDNERKCTNGQIANVRFKNVHGGIWGAMGHTILVSRCQGDAASDVAFDAEGCVDVTFERCRAENAKNGCFTTFYLNRGIRFLDCEGVQPSALAPLFRIYNSTQSAMNGDILVEGGRFECLDGIGTFDSARGPARLITLRNAELVNVRVDFSFNNNNQIIIERNALRFTRTGGTAFSAITAGGTNATGGVQGHVVVTRNRITSVGQPAGSRGIHVRQADYNGNPVSEVIGNMIAGFGEDIACEWLGKNPGRRPIYRVTGNQGSAGITRCQ